VQGASESGVLVFKGIPYGADTATTRFQAPQSPVPWSERRNTISFGDSCPRTAYPPGTAGGLFESWGNPVPLSEDCLRLNVWTPALRDDRNRPVMVWFHGGGFTRGSGSSAAYEGVRLTNRDAAASARAAGQLLMSLDLDGDSVDAILDRSTEEVQQAAAAVVTAGNAPGWTGPILDNRHIERQPFTPDAPPQAREVPMLIGVNRTETSLFIGARNPETFDATWETLPVMLQAAIPDVDA
jgi:carboxylesterase type B